MSDKFWLTEAQLTRLKPFFPRSRGVPRVDDRRVISGIIDLWSITPSQAVADHMNMVPTRLCITGSFAGRG